MSPKSLLNDKLKLCTIDQEEFLYLLNLIVSPDVKKMYHLEIGGEQPWLNTIYKWEKFDIGQEYNVRTGVVKVKA